MSTTQAPWANRIVAHGEEPPEKLVPNPENWRRHDAAQQRALASVLGEVGLVQSVVVNRTTGRLVDGHLRVELAVAQGQPSVPVVYVELSEEEERLVLASLDPIAAMATADRDKLQELLASLEIKMRRCVACSSRSLARNTSSCPVSRGLSTRTSFPSFPRSLSPRGAICGCWATTVCCAATRRDLRTSSASWTANAPLSWPPTRLIWSTTTAAIILRPGRTARRSPPKKDPPLGHLHDHGQVGRPST